MQDLAKPRRPFAEPSARRHTIHIGTYDDNTERRHADGNA